MKPKEFLVELDFLSRDNVLAPVFRDPPEYSIKEASGYFEGARPYAPEWMDEEFTSLAHRAIISILGYYGLFNKYIPIHFNYHNNL